MSRRTRCAHCGQLGAENTWRVQACADGRRRRVVKLCEPCDVKANQWMLTFFRVPGAEAKLQEYSR